MRADDVAELAVDMGLERVKIGGKEQWDGSRAFILSFGAPAHRYTLIVNPDWDKDEVRGAIDGLINPPVPVKAEPKKRKSAQRLTV